MLHSFLPSAADWKRFGGKLDPREIRRRLLAPNDRHILVINGHPDTRDERFCAALCRAYVEGASASGRQTQTVRVGDMTSDHDLADTDMENAIAALGWADKLIVIFPLWLDRPPAQLQTFFKTAALSRRRDAAPVPARFIVTMGMPAFAHRKIYRAQNGDFGRDTALHLTGMQVRDHIFIGGTDTMSEEQRKAWLRTVRAKAGD